MINIKKFTFNPVAVNTFVVWDETRECVIVDAACYYGEEQDELEYFITQNELKPVRLINTHGHFDHVMGINYACERWNLEPEVHVNDAPLIEGALEHARMFGLDMPQPKVPNVFLKEEEAIGFGNSTLKVIHVPGHSPGGVAFHSEADSVLFVGDILFNGSVGRTDLPMGNHEQLIRGIREKLFVLSPETKVYCGHGPETTIEFESKNNPFCRIPG